MKKTSETRGFFYVYSVKTILVTSIEFILYHFCVDLSNTLKIGTEVAFIKKL